MLVPLLQPISLTYVGELLTCSESLVGGGSRASVEMFHRHTVLLRINETELTEEVALTYKLVMTSWNIIVFPH